MSNLLLFYNKFSTNYFVYKFIGPSIFALQLGANEEILSINLNSLSTSLKDIPIYQKLSLKHTVSSMAIGNIEFEKQFQTFFVEECFSN